MPLEATEQDVVKMRAVNVVEHDPILLERLLLPVPAAFNPPDHQR